MATNRVYRTKTLRLYVGVGRVSGDAVVIGTTIRGVCLNDADANGVATVDLGSECAVYRKSVLASTDDGSPIVASAVAFGDAIYLNLTSRILSKDASGTTKFGVALGTVDEDGGYATGTQLAAGETGDCDILILPAS